MSTPEEPKPPRKRKTASRKKTAPRKKAAPRKKKTSARKNESQKTGQQESLALIEAPPKALSKAGPEPSKKLPPKAPTQPQSPAREQPGGWRIRQRRTLDPEALPPVREPWSRRLRHHWRRSRLAREIFPWLIVRLGAYARLTRINRPIGTFLLLWPTLWALWLAGDGHPAPLYFVVFVVGTFLMRSAGCAINDFADRKIDSHVWRTEARPLARGEIHPAEALGVFAVLAAAAFVLAFFTLNRLALLLAIPGAFLAASYPFMKRYTQLPQLYLGVAFGWGIPMAFAAETGALPPVAWLLLIINILWATVYDTMYAMADRPDDIKIGVKSTAILFGEMDRVIVGMLQVTVLIGLALAGLRLHLLPVYYCGLGAAACFSLYQQWLIKDRDPHRCFQAVSYT
ncbi:MAG: 4-hydroxybenzoate octaprenyltransferase, partial [Gammaproteobacteria bacterium]